MNRGVDLFLLQHDLFGLAPGGPVDGADGGAGLWA